MNWDALGAMAEALPRASQFGFISMLSYSTKTPPKRFLLDSVRADTIGFARCEF